MKRSSKNLIYAASSLFAVFVLAIPLGLFKGEIPLVHVLCNAFFVCGVLEGGVGLLTWAASEGTFDIFSYAGKVILYKFKPKEKLPSYYDYIQERKENRKGWLKELAVCGGVCILIAFVLLFL